MSKNFKFILIAIGLGLIAAFSILAAVYKPNFIFCAKNGGYLGGFKNCMDMAREDPLRFQCRKLLDNNSCKTNTKCKWVVIPWYQQAYCDAQYAPVGI